jgi:hypothetical protein
MLRRTISATLVSFLLASAAYAGSGPITSVKLSSGGVAEVVRTAAVDDTGTVEIAVPIDQVDDLLKSLAIFSSKASVRDLSLAGPQPIEETFARLPFTPEDLNSFSRIIGAMKGSKVTLDGQTDIVYTVVGVEEKPKEGKSSLVLLTWNSELKAVPLDPTTTVKFVEPEAQKKIDDAVALLAASAADGMRTVKVQLAKTDEKDVAISYVVAAPVWKPTYKLIVQDGGKARLQAWAVLENASGEDWNEVSITLSSGKPVTLKQRLHDRIWKNRDEVGAEDRATEVAQVRGMAMKLAEADLATFGGIGAAAPAPAVAEALAPASATEELAMASFELPGKFTVRNGDTLSVPIVDKEVEAGFVSLFNPNARHPNAALLIKNNTGSTLPAGIMTVYDSKGGYVGDARFDDIAAGGDRRTVFGTDLKMDQMVERQAHETVTSVKLADWKLQAQKVSTITATWKVKAGDEGRTVVVEDQIPEGYRVASGQIVEETAEGVRIKAAVKPGETASLVVKYQREEQEEMVAADPDESRIALWISGTADEAVKTKLQAVLDATAALGEANRKLQLTDERYGEIEREQARLRGNLAGVDDAALKRRWIDKMTTLEDELEALVDTKKKVETSIELLRKKLGDRVKTF